MVSVVVLTGVGAGLGDAALTVLLHLLQHRAFGYTEDTFLIGVRHASARRRVLAPALAGLLAGVGWWALRRDGRQVPTVDDALSGRVRRLAPGGAVYTLEVLLASFALPTVAAAVATSGTATVVAWTVLPNRPTYDVAGGALSPTIVLVLEFTHTGPALLAPAVLAVAGAILSSRLLRRIRPGAG